MSAGTESLTKEFLMANYSKSFNDAFERLSTHEGWGDDGNRYDSQDKGGRHRWGISERANPDLNFDTLTKDDAKRIFKERYWDAIKADDLPESIRGTAFDAAVNQGPGFARRALAEAGGDPEVFNQLRADRYNRIIERDPSQQRYLNGWMNRLNSYRGTPAERSNGSGQVPSQAAGPQEAWPEQQAYEGALIGRGIASGDPAAAQNWNMRNAPPATQAIFNFLAREPSLSDALTSLMPRRRQQAAPQPVQVAQPTAAANFQEALSQPLWDPYARTGLQWGR